MSRSPLISFVMATQNRRDVLISTLERLREPERSGADSEIIVVVNPSSDGTSDAIRARFPDVHVIHSKMNLGSCAKAIGTRRAEGRYVVFLDDDSYPHPGCISRMVEKFERDEHLGAAGCVVHLPDGRRECSALPHVFVGCGVGFRREALEAVGGLDATLFMQAEEYDLSFRLVGAGWEVETFTDLVVDHLKTMQARLTGRSVYYDTRNNLLLTARYLPGEYERIYRDDWRQRYGWIAVRAGRHIDYWRGRLAESLRRRAERNRFAQWRLSASAMETLFHIDCIARKMRGLADTGVRNIVLAELGKNIYPFVHAAEQLGLNILAIADDRFSDLRLYRGHIIMPVLTALAKKPDAIVISNTSPVHAERAHTRLAGMTSVPIHRWFGYDIT